MDDRVYFMPQEKRLVIRPIYNFPQGNTTTGQNNEKFYMLYQLYLLILYFNYTSTAIKSFEYENFKYGFDFHVIRMCFFIFFSILLFSLYLTNFLVDWKYAIFNITPIELAESNFKHTRSITKNIQKVYVNLYLLFLPIPSKMKI